MAEAGGLAAYGTRIVGICRAQVSRQMIKICAVERPTAFELVINLRIAKTANLDLATGIVALP
jgi:hypothetical protein